VNGRLKLVISLRIMYIISNFLNRTGE
jgi:hypothetical protein